MKYTKLAICCALIINSNTQTLDDFTNQTYMFVRPVFDSIGLQQSSWHNIVFQKQKNGSALQIYPIYEQSFEQKNNAAYFLFHHKNSLTIQVGSASTFNPDLLPNLQNPAQGQIGVATFTRDILGQWVGINKPNDSPASFTLKPTQRQACVMCEFSQDLSALTNSSLFENWFINVELPITWVENNIGVSGDQKALDAFNNSSFNFGRIRSGDHSSIRLTQVSISLGTKYIAEPDTHIISQTGVIIPLVEQNCNTFLFEPVQGFNAHFGLTSHALFQFPIVKKHENANSTILFFLDVHNNFLCRNHQLRTYDIKNKPYSRYIQLLDRATNSLVPAMNVLTLRSRVEPFIIANFATGLRLKYKNSVGEIGYELWAHGNEKVTPEFKSGDYDECGNIWYDNRYGIAFINTDGVLAKINTTSGAVEALTAGELGQTASQSTINHVAAPDGNSSCCPEPLFVQQNKYLTLKDLDKFSCAARSTITHRAFASIGFGNAGHTRDCFANFGLFIEASQNNASLCFWGGWFKAGITF